MAVHSLFELLVCFSLALNLFLSDDITSQNWYGNIVVQ